MVAREIDLEVKRVYAPTPMIHEPIFSLHAVAAPTMQDTMVSAPIVIPHVATMNENKEPVLQDSIEPIATHEGSNNSLKQKMCQKWRPLEGLKELENQLFLLTMKYTTLRNFKWRMIPPHLKKP